MKKVFYLVAASLLMTSCLEDPMVEAYNEDFVSVFGNTDPHHTWKMVENQSVEVNLDKSSRVKIYVKFGNTYRLAADYENVSGTRTLSYDAPMGCEDIFVTVDGVPYYGVNSREIVKPESPVVKVNGYFDITYVDLLKFHVAQSLPEKGDNRHLVTDTGCKFKAIGATDKVTYKFYPIYWGAEFKHEYGMYYLDENGVKQDCNVFYTPKNTDEGKCLLFVDENGGEVPVTENYVRKLFPNFPDLKLEELEEYIENLDETLKKRIVFKSPCFEIEIKQGTIFGFYVKTYYQNGDYKGCYYSDPELNQSSRIISTFAYLHNDGDDNTNTSYITVEDFDDNDYNDFIFMMSGAHVHFEDKPMQYIYAVEDLGGANDFDFNDVVFSVSHVKGKENATVQPLAAGGVYPAEIWFNSKRCGEIHKDMFGVSTSQMINTKEGTTESSMLKADPFLVNVGANWSHAAYGGGEVPGNGFSVKVNLPDRKKDIVATTYEPGSDSKPQMLVLSEGWLWPTEKTRISDAYQGFGEWGENYTKQTWVNYPKQGLVVNWK